MDTFEIHNYQDWKFRFEMALRLIHEIHEWESKEDDIQLEEIEQDLHSTATQNYSVLAQNTQGQTQRTMLEQKHGVSCASGFTRRPWANVCMSDGYDSYRHH